jgi:predicted transcriptional regulator
VPEGLRNLLKGGRVSDVRGVGRNGNAAMPWREAMLKFSGAFQFRPPKEVRVSDEDKLTLIRGTLALANYLYDVGDKDVETAMIIGAVVMGTLEKNPLDISAISSVTNIPRATVQRKLQSLPVAFKDRVAFNQDGRRTIVTVSHDDLLTENRYQTLKAIMMNVCAKLSCYCPLWALC